MATSKTRDNLVAPDPAEADVIARLHAEIGEIYREYGQHGCSAPTAR